MGVSSLELLLIICIITIPLAFFLPAYLSKKNNKKFDKFAQHFKLSNVNNINQIKSRHNFIVLPIDKILLDDEIVELCTEIYTTPTKQKTYSMYANQHHKFYTSYIQQRWDMAKVIAGSLRTAWDGQLTAYYDSMIVRCTNFKQKPPTMGWNGTVLKG
jgi:hypothetical protein